MFAGQVPTAALPKKAVPPPSSCFVWIPSLRSAGGDRDGGGLDAGSLRPQTRWGQGETAHKQRDAKKKKTPHGFSGPAGECQEFNSIDNQLPLLEMRREGIWKRPRERSLSSSRDPRDGQQDTLRAALQSSPGPASTIRLQTQPKPTEMSFLWCRELLQQQLVLYP